MLTGASGWRARGWYFDISGGLLSKVLSGGGGGGIVKGRVVIDQQILFGQVQG